MVQLYEMVNNNAYSNYGLMTVLLHQTCEAAADSARCNRQKKTLTPIKNKNKKSGSNNNNNKNNFFKVDDCNFSTQPGAFTNLGSLNIYKGCNRPTDLKTENRPKRDRHVYYQTAVRRSLTFRSEDV